MEQQPKVASSSKYLYHQLIGEIPSMFAEAPNRNTIKAPARPCPRCGSNHVTSSSYRYDPRRGVVISPNTRSATIWGLLTWVVGTFLLKGVLPYFFGGPSSVVATIPFWVPVALAGVVVLAVSVVQEWQRTNAVRIDEYTCRDCGHEWSLRDGRQVPDKRT
ncbi:MAG: hypothetical protein QOH93_1220 [Chloroflexia bacterium]|nr:hypothetical protein [Chloroflexia bacterium]